MTITERTPEERAKERDAVKLSNYRARLFWQQAITASALLAAIAYGLLWML